MTSNFYSHLDLPSDLILSSCIHCGMCLQACPTYNLNYDELSSPRGRIRLIKYVAEGKLPITE
ncbi:MAG: 4Fe-4S dicluster domain-containing protein, partial [Ignavibacteria bacterium]